MTLKVGDLVWAKMKGYRTWPGKIEEPSSDTKPPKNKKVHLVYFFGTNNFAWVLEENITLHNESFLDNLGKKTSAFQSAINDLIAFSKSNLRNKCSPKKGKYKSYSKKSPAKDFKVENNTSNKLDKVLSYKNIKKSAKKRMLDKNYNGGYNECTSPKSRKLVCAEEYPLVGNTPSDVDNNSVINTVNTFLTDVEEGRRSSLLQSKDIPSSAKKIGFIGLGCVGRNVVHAFLRFGHDVTVWNRTSSKCETFTRIGAKKALSPAELIVTCDITFCSVSDPEASKSLLFGDRGILKGFEQAEKLGFRNRGYVEMTTLDPETSQEIAEAIGRKNGKYLEAPISGSSEDALNGQLLILASGDRKLFIDCETCFQVIGRHAYYLSCEVGMGAKFCLLLNSFTGTMCTIAAECLSLVNRLGLKNDVYLDILEGGPLKSQTIIEKCEKMLKCDFKTVTPLKHVQKDLNFCLLLANQCNQPMPVIAAANEVYKHARLLQYSDSDVSAVYQGVRH